MSSVSNSHKLEADVLVVGGGGSGMAAAISARENGVRNVTVLEKRHVTGGNSAFAEGIFAVESPAQKRLGIEARRDEIFEQAMDFARWKINPEIVRRYIDMSGGTIYWLEKKGLKFDRVRPCYPGQNPLVWHSAGAKLGPALVKTLAKNCEEAGVKVLTGITAKKLVKSKDGEITGVSTKSGDRELTFTAKSIIIASGGYGGNKRLMKKYYPFYSDTIFHRGIAFSGDGLIMAMEAGAATEGLGALILFSPHFHKSRRVSAIARRPETVWVNKRGERFINEAVGPHFPMAGNAIDRQPGQMSYTLFDEGLKQKMVTETDFRYELIGGGNNWLENLDKDLQLHMTKGRIRISYSWDEIASWIGAMPEVLRTTINEYNSYCDRGYDPMFVKDRLFLIPLRTPPYYAIQCDRGFDNTLGGIKVNQYMEALDRTGNAIPGLYAAGTDTGGWEADTYNYTLSGTSIGFAICSGRMAGESAAKYILKE